MIKGIRIKLSKTMKFLLFIVLMTSGPGYSQDFEIDSTSFEKLNGLEITKAEKELDSKSRSGIIIGWVEPSEVPIMTWAFSVFIVDQGKLFILEEVLNDETREKENQFIIRDQLMIATSNPNYIVELGCKVKGQDIYPKGNYMGMYESQENTKEEEIIKAWKMDFEKGRIIEISTEGVKCDSELFDVSLDKDI